MAACVGQGYDVLSTLPRDILEKIIKSITIEDAIKLGTLSHHLRQIWRSHPRVTLDQRLLEDCIRDKEKSDFVLLEKLQGLVLLHLEGSILKVFLSTVRFPHCFPSVLCTLRHMLLRTVSFDDSDQLSSSLDLIRSSPNLETLHIQACSYGDEGKAREPIRVRPQADRVKLPHLRTVKLFGLRGLKEELLLIGIIMSSSPVIETIYMEFKVDKWQKLVIWNSLGGNATVSKSLKIRLRTDNYRSW